MANNRMYALREISPELRLSSLIEAKLNDEEQREREKNHTHTRMLESS